MSFHAVCRLMRFSAYEEAFQLDHGQISECYSGVVFDDPVAFPACLWGTSGVTLDDPVAYPECRVLSALTLKHPWPCIHSVLKWRHPLGIHRQTVCFDFHHPNQARMS